MKGLKGHGNETIFFDFSIIRLDIGPLHNRLLTINDTGSRQEIPTLPFFQQGEQYRYPPFCTCHGLV